MEASNGSHLRLAASASPSARDLVTGVLVEEHRTLRIVLSILQRLLHEISQFGREPDFHLLAEVLYYIDDFPERVHHPKEDRYLFPVVRRRTARFDALLDRLRTDHARSAQMLVRIQRDLVHFQAGDPKALSRLSTNVATYAALLEEHLQAEERLLSDVCDELTEDDWAQLARGFAADRDPLTAGDTRHEFRVLRARILNALPTKMRLDTGAAETMRGDPPKG
ncbi:MAG TPA: hemerythrin domain-containing protein [Burkholderiales bacterium]|nr:hemerythrin domain-containing protein [Burkholderiales bacterium]